MMHFLQNKVNIVITNYTNCYPALETGGLKDIRAVTTVKKCLNGLFYMEAKN